MSELIFDDSILRGSMEEVAARGNALKAAGCMLLKRSITTVARSLVGTPKRTKGVPLLTTAAFIQHCYGSIGVHMSHLAQIQREGMRDLAWGEACTGDLLCFIAKEAPNQVLNGIVTDQKTVVFVCPWRKRVVEETFEALATANLRGIKKMLPPSMQRKTIVIRLPPGRGLKPTPETVAQLITAHLPGLAAE